MPNPSSLSDDLTLTSFPFNSQVTEETEEPKENSGFRGFFNKLFSDGASASSGPAVPKSEPPEPNASTSESIPSCHIKEISHKTRRVKFEAYFNASLDCRDGKKPRTVKKRCLNDCFRTQQSWQEASKIQVDAQTFDPSGSQPRISNRLSKIIWPHNERELMDYNRSIFRQFWMPDSTGKECYECHERFTTFRRRHHCRFCGQIFCGKCCNRQISGAKLGYNGMLRLCNYCLGRVGIYHESESRTISNTPVSVSPVPSDKLCPQNCSQQSLPQLIPSSTHERITADDVLDSLNINDEKPLNLSLDRFDLLPDHRSMKSAYEPCADVDEPEWVRNLNTQRECESGGVLFAPPQFSANNSSTSDSASEPTAPTSSSCLSFEVRKNWHSPLILNDDLNQPHTIANLFDAQTEAVLDFLFEREQISKATWKPLLWPLSAEIVKIIQVDTQLRPKLINILDYVHIKKLQVNGVPSVERINGVVFSKALHHKSMLSYGENASILLLSGNISYERVIDKVSSLEPILAQENDYIQNQIDRIASRKVSLLLVENSVSTPAVEMLVQAQIGLCTNIKPVILERIARSTNADILSSLDAQFLQPRTGFCPRYYARKIRLVDGSQKELMVLDECDPSLGISIVIRAPSLREVYAVKRIMRLLLQLRYSNRCEQAFIELFNAVGPSLRSTCSVCALNQDADSDLPERLSEFVKAMRTVPLTNSPLIRLTPPYLETFRGKDCFLLPYFKKPPFHFYSQEELIEAAKKEQEAEQQLRTLTFELSDAKLALQQKHVHSVHRKNFLPDLTSKMPEFRARSVLNARRLNEIQREMTAKCTERQAELRLKALNSLPKAVARNVDVLNPYKHQRRAFLYCAEAGFRRFQNTGSFCSGPSLLVWRFYESGEDMTIGTFLRRFCFNAEYRCKECDKTMLDHFRKIIHNRVCISITTQNIGPKADTQIMNMCETADLGAWEKTDLIAWKYCAKCGIKSKIKRLDSLSQNLSFAKFIDYLANAVHWISEMTPQRDERKPDIELSKCEHCTFHEHCHLFSMQNTVTVFEVKPVKPLHILFAPMLCTVASRLIPCRSLLTEFYELKRLGVEMFHEIEPVITESFTSSILDHLRKYFESMLNDFVLDKKFNQIDSVQSDDPVYIQADETLTRARHFLNSLVDEWNDRRTQQQTVALAELEPSAKLRNLCAKFNLNLNSSDKDKQSTDEIFCLDTGNFLSASTASLNSSTIGMENNTPLTAPPSKPPNVILPTPFAKQYHFELPIHKASVPIVVRDSIDSKGHSIPDVGSMIAFALASKDYADKRRLLNSQNNIHTEIFRKRGSSNNSFGNLQNSTNWASSIAAAGAASVTAGPSAYSPTSGFLSANLSSSSLNVIGHLAEPSTSDNPNAQSIEVDFADSKAHYYVKVYFAESFHKLRDSIFVAGEHEFLRSLSRSSTWSPQGGKSGASFFRTNDERFVFKQMSRLEMESFKTCAPRYFDYINTALKEKKLTSLCKIYGVYRIGYTSKQESSQLKMDFLVMEYLFYQKNVKQMWDLKGSLRNRYASTKTDAPVLLDENLVQDLWSNQLYVHHHSKIALKQAIHNDSHFLSSLDVMDYSLLAGICHENDEVIVGIVDYMRTYTLDKRVETLVKTALPITHLPTIINPENYCKRFCEAIDGYFAMAGISAFETDCYISY